MRNLLPALLTVAALSGGCPLFPHGKPEHCVPPCRVLAAIYDPEPILDAEMVVLVAQNADPDSFFLQSVLFRVPTAPEVTVSAWRVRCPPESDLHGQRCFIDPTAGWNQGVVLAEIAEGWTPVPGLNDPKDWLAVHDNLSWQGSETFPDWAFRRMARKDQYFHPAYAQSSAPPPSIEYRICRYFTGDPATGDVFGKNWSGSCNDPSLPGPWNNWEGTSWAE